MVVEQVGLSGEPAQLGDREVELGADVVEDVPQPMFNVRPGLDGTLPALACLPAVKSWRPPNTGAAPIQAPRWIAVSASNDVFVASTGDNKVKVFDAQGSFNRAISLGAAKPSAVAMPYAKAITFLPALYSVTRSLPFSAPPNVSL